MFEIDRYLEALEAPNRDALQRVREIVRTTVPDAVEAISYGMPAFKYRNSYLVGYRAFKKHLSFFPTAEPIEALHDQLGDFKLSKGTIQFTVESPLPEETIQKLVLIRVAAITKG